MPYTNRVDIIALNSSPVHGANGLLTVVVFLPSYRKFLSQLSTSAFSGLHFGVNV